MPMLDCVFVAQVGCRQRKTLHESRQGNFELTALDRLVRAKLPQARPPRILHTKYTQMSRIWYHVERTMNSGSGWDNPVLRKGPNVDPSGQVVS